MKDEVFEIFGINTDALSVNRGFYYQYLVTLKKWLENYILNKEVIVNVDVGDDIKEVGDELIFTQVKCYSSVFNLNSREIIKSIFHFFLLFLKYEEENTRFCFVTNTKVAKQEKILRDWIANPTLNNIETKKHVHDKIIFLLKKEINERKKRKKNRADSDKINRNYSGLHNDV